VRIQVQAPAEVDNLTIAQAIVGPEYLLKAERVKAPQSRSFDRWKALNQLGKKVQRLYDDQMDLMILQIKKEMSEISGMTLHKAEATTKPLMTPQQLDQIAQIIRDHHTAFVVAVGADPAAGQAEIQRLIDQGILPPQTFDIITDSYQYGQLVGSLREFDTINQAKEFTYEKFKKQIRKRPRPLTSQEQHAIDWTKHSVAVHCKGLGNKIADDFSRVIIDADSELRKQTIGQIRTEVEHNIERRKVWKDIASEMGHFKEDWSRDWGRIAATEKQNAMQEGFASSLAEREGPVDQVYVSKIPKPDACPECIRLYLENGQGSPPKVFTLAELQENGTNVGRKARDWKAVVGVTHPWCACELVHIPPGWGFETKPPKDEDWQGVPRKPGAFRRKDGESWEYWRPSLVPESLRLSFQADRSLMKASFMQYTNVPESGVSVRVGDPLVVGEIDKVLARTPQQIFDRNIGVTLITTDIARPQSALDLNDLAYWTGNEIRISQTLPAERIGRVLEHELGHSLNVHLMRKFGSAEPVHEWHRKLDKISAKEGRVSAYSKKHPIENAAEVTRMYLYDRGTLMGRYPKQYKFVDADYRDVVPAIKFVVNA
jgi:hypothetical protein